MPDIRFALSVCVALAVLSRFCWNPIVSLHLAYKLTVTSEVWTIFGNFCDSGYSIGYILLICVIQFSNIYICMLIGYAFVINAYIFTDQNICKTIFLIISFSVDNIVSQQLISLNVSCPSQLFNS